MAGCVKLDCLQDSPDVAAIVHAEPSGCNRAVQQQRLVSLDEVDVQSEPLGLAQQDGLPDCTGEVVRSDTYVGKTRIDAVTCRKLLRDNPGALNVVSQPNWEFYQS